MRRFSLFLTPEAGDFAYTAGLIRELSYTCGGMPFEPHVTVHSGVLSSPGTLRNAVYASMQGIGPFALRIRRVGCGEGYFRSLYLEFEEHHVLRQLHERIRDSVAPGSELEFFPHLSLLYSDMALRHRQSLAKRVILDRSCIHFDGLKIVTPLNRELGWRDTSQWQTLFHVGFGASRPETPARTVISDES